MRVIDRIELVPLARNSITRRDLLLQELESIRKRGYATSIEETDEDAIGIAAPVFDRSHYPIAGIGIYAPLSRVPEDQFPRFAKFVLETCNELSNLLGANLGIHQATVSLSNKVNTP
jgi:DNA-binding IclR family transcriptional regulator